MSTPLISVIIPAYNHERFVGAAVDSVLRQTAGDLELIVINDGSTDRTGEVVQGCRDPRLRYYAQENRDAYNTLNRGLERAQGRFVAVLNSDDFYALPRLERLLALQRETGAACLFSDVQAIAADGTPLRDPAFVWNRWHQKNRAFYFQCGDLYTAFLKGNLMVTTSNLFLTAEAARRVGPFRALRYLHDYDYIFRVMLAHPGAVRYVHDETLLFYRIHGGNTLSGAAVIGREQDRAVIRQYMLARVPEPLRPLVEAGCDRLIALEHELLEVKAQLHGAPAPSVRRQARALLATLRWKLGRALGR
jgi:glycosyltransferase involved in cell wall biosynthesis